MQIHQGPGIRKSRLVIPAPRAPGDYSEQRSIVPYILAAQTDLVDVQTRRVNLVRVSSSGHRPDRQAGLRSSSRKQASNSRGPGAADKECPQSAHWPRRDSETPLAWAYRRLGSLPRREIRSSLLVPYPADACFLEMAAGIQALLTFREQL